MQQHSTKQPSGLRIAGNIALIISLLLCTWLLSGAVAYGWLLHADNYGTPFHAFGAWMLGLCGGMTAAVILYFLKRDLPAAVLGILCYLPMLGIMLSAINTAELRGWSGQTEASFGVNAAAVWRNGLMWNAVTILLLLLLTLTRYLSYDARSARSQRKKARESQPAPSILEDDE